MKIKSGFVVRKVGTDHVVVPVGEMCKQFHGMINLNETGAMLWNFFSKEHTLDEAVDMLLAEYDVAREVAQADVEKFMKLIQDNHFNE
jgi:hypothetical protein